MESGNNSNDSRKNSVASVSDDNSVTDEEERETRTGQEKGWKEKIAAALQNFKENLSHAPKFSVLKETISNLIDKIKNFKQRSKQEVEEVAGDLSKQEVEEIARDFNKFTTQLSAIDATDLDDGTVEVIEQLSVEFEEAAAEVKAESKANKFLAALIEPFKKLGDACKSLAERVRDKVLEVTSRRHGYKADGIGGVSRQPGKSASPPPEISAPYNGRINESRTKITAEASDKRYSIDLVNAQLNDNTTPSQSSDTPDVERDVQKKSRRMGK
ncbi:MAG: hypothetical protein OEY79_01970 [Anaplasmataceae bacterium]|nr:hypothetical protein [Anaplasmataceae bacterium]